MAGSKQRALFWFRPHLREFLLSPEIIDDLSSMVELVEPTSHEPSEFARLLPSVDMVCGTWGLPTLQDAWIDSAPRLKAVFYAAGSVKSWVCPAIWRRDIRVTACAGVNGVPVSHYTLAMILLALKNVLPRTISLRTEGARAWDGKLHPVTGVGPHAVVGLIAMSKIGRLVRALLRPFPVRVLVYDPYYPADRAQDDGVEVVGLDELLSRSDVISVHAPNTPETRHMLHAGILNRIQPGATLINTARGALIDHDALAVELKRGDWTAVLDVTDPEPLPEGHPLYTLPNCFLTPHVAGSMGAECRDMSRQMVAEVQRFLAGEPAIEGITEQSLATMA